MPAICCISDCHLGFRHRLKKQRLADYERAFNEAFDLALQREPSLIILGGDVFHHPKPDPVSMRVFLKRLLKAADSTPVVMCIGNHEIETIIGTSYTPIFSDLHENVHVLTSENPHVYLDLDGKKVGVHGFQYIRSRRFAEETLERVASEVSGSDLNILCMHQAVEGYLEPHEISLSSLRQSAEGFDLILSGHVHQHQTLGEVSDLTPAYYIGSTERISFNEAGNQTGFLVFQDFDFQKPEFMPIESAKMRSVRRSLGKMRPEEINVEVRRLIEENMDASCLQLSVSASVDGDYFDVCHDWETHFPDFTILDVSVEPVFDSKERCFEVSLEGDVVEDYFEKTGLSDRQELRSLCKRLYEQYGGVIL